MSELKTVLVLCTGNSCRSQMGEAILNHELAGLVRASAGTEPQPKVADGAIEALKLAGLPTDGLYPKTVEDVMDQDIDLVVSVCDNAKELPDLPAPGEAHPRGFHDPTASRWRASSRCATTSAPAWCRRSQALGCRHVLPNVK
jgi:arsenate reductase